MSVGFRRCMVCDSASACSGNVFVRYASPYQFRGNKTGSRYTQRIVDSWRTCRTVGCSGKSYGQTIFLRHASQFVKIEHLWNVRQMCRIETEKEIYGRTDTFTIGM